jgi:hypothetical protein
VRWEENIKMNLKEMDGSVDRIHLAQDRYKWQGVVNTVTELRVV